MRTRARAEWMGWLVGNRNNWLVEMRADWSETSRHGQVGKLAGHPDGWAIKPVQMEFERRAAWSADKRARAGGQVGWTS